MADYFLSDVHLRHDRPDRGLRLASLVDRLGPADSIRVVGDLCDFWLAARQRAVDPSTCPGLRSLAEFVARGGALTVLPGNHDGRLRNYYARSIGGRWEPGSIRMVSHGLKIHAEHGHRLGGVPPLKVAMESRAFLEAFRRIPRSIAVLLERRLDRANVDQREADDRRHLAFYRRKADDLSGDVDLVVLGHVHRVFDDREGSPRLVVLGGWHEGMSFLRIDETGSSLFSSWDESRSRRVGLGE